MRTRLELLRIIVNKENYTMKKEYPGILKSILYSIMIMFLITGCMMMGMRRSGNYIESVTSKSPIREQMVNTKKVIDTMIEEIVKVAIMDMPQMP